MAIEASKWAWSLKLTGNQKLVIVALADFARWPLAILWHDQKTIAAKVGVSADTIQRVMREFERSGLVRRVRRHGSNGRRIADLIVLLANEESRNFVEALMRGDPSAHKSLPAGGAVTGVAGVRANGKSRGLGESPGRNSNESQAATVRQQQPLFESLSFPLTPTIGKSDGGCSKAPDLDDPGARDNFGEQTWIAVRGALARRHGVEITSSWFDKITFVGVVASTATLAGPTKFIVDEFRNRYGDQVRAEWRRIDPSVSSVDVIVRPIKAIDNCEVVRERTSEQEAVR